MTRRVRDRFPSSVVLVVGAAAVVVLFLFAVQLLGAATNAATPALRSTLESFVVGDASALGLGWLAAYGLAGGSVVAAVALSLFDAGLVSRSQLFLLVAGSRLGAAAIVVFVGAFDFAQRERFSLRESTALGLLAFLVTHSVYLPAAALGYAVLPAVTDPVADAGGPRVGVGGSLSAFDAVTTAVTDTLGPVPSVVLAVAVLFGSLRLFDRVLDRVDTETLRDRLFSRLRRTWVSFATGLVVTIATTSVAFSLGVVVPLYNRGYVERDELVPYTLGANLGTLADTLVVAAVLGAPVGVATVLVLLGFATAVTLALLAVSGPYAAVVATAHDRLLEDRRAFAAFAVVLVAVPLAFVAVPLAVG